MGEVDKLPLAGSAPVIQSGDEGSGPQAGSDDVGIGPPDKGWIAIRPSTLLFNNFFWFPEAFLIFWVLAALYALEDKDSGDEREKREFFPAGFTHFIKRYKTPLHAVALVLFLAFNLFQFNALHPSTCLRDSLENFALP